MKQVNVEDAYKKSRNNEELTELENKALLLDALQFLENENFHGHISVIEKLTGYSMSALEKEIELIN